MRIRQLLVLIQSFTESLALLLYFTIEFKIVTLDVQFQKFQNFVIVPKLRLSGKFSNAFFTDATLPSIAMFVYIESIPKVTRSVSYGILILRFWIENTAYFSQSQDAESLSILNGNERISK